MAKKPTYRELEQRLRELEQKVTKSSRVKDALKKSARRLSTLLDFVPYPIEVLTMDGRVSYVNAAFTQLFGWSLEELEGRFIPFIPKELEQDTAENFEKLLRDKALQRHETRRLTKDGRILDVARKALVYSDFGDEPDGALVLFRDITDEKRAQSINDAMLRISMALPAYPDLEDLLDYISSEVKRLLNVEGAIVILLDADRKELFFLGTAYDDRVTQRRAKEIRFPAHKGVAGKVVKTGEPVIVPDTSKDPDFYSVVDERLGYESRNLLDVPLKTAERVIGVLCAINKKEGVFDHTDIDMLSMIAGTVAISVENARVSNELKKAYEEVSSLNRAKDSAINHLSHELKTPVAVLSSSLHILMRKLASLPEETWKPTLERASRNLERIMDIEYEVEDIMLDRNYKAPGFFSRVLDQCADQLEALIAEKAGEGPVVEHVRRRIDELYGPKELVPQEVFLNEFVNDRLALLVRASSHRQVDIVTNLESTPPILIPLDPLQKIVDGLIKNAIENTPDEGKIEIFVRKKGRGTELVVHDYGVGITRDNQNRIFEGFFSTRDTMDYSSKRAFDFNAGGKGADLLRMKIFSERYHFKIEMETTRCRFIPRDSDVCPGRISECAFCKEREECYRSGETVFYLYFPPAGKMAERSG